MPAQLDKTYLSHRPTTLWSRLVAYLLFEGRPLTTRGRWINPLVLAFLRTASKAPLSTAAPDPAPVFIMGVGRSGTTLLGKILGLHPELGFLNEPKALWHISLGDDDLIGSYARQPGRYRMTANDANPAKTRTLRRLYRAFALLSGRRGVVDKYPELLFRTELVDQLCPGARRIIILRDGWQAAASIARWSDSHCNPKAQTDWWGKNDRKWTALRDQILLKDPTYLRLWPVLNGLNDQANRAAIEWIATMREALIAKESAPDLTLLLPFEDLVSNPGRSLRHILNFLELPQDPALLAYAKDEVRPPKEHPRPDLHPLVAAELARTMTLLGYEQEAA